MYTYNIVQWITFFFIYCFFGWIFESSYVSLRKRRFVNRGFLRLPMLPLYGTGAVMMLWVSLPVKDNLLLVYISGVIAATLLEYVTGWAMERLFKMKYWDYSNQPFQLHGYICLSSSIAWGFLTIFLTEVIHRPIERAVLQMNPALELALVVMVGAVFTVDTIQSVREALDLGRALEAMTKLRAELEEAQVQLALLKAEASERLEDFHEGISERLEDFREDISEHRQEAIAELTERLQTLTEKRKKLSGHMNFYRKGILRGNPTASSKRFNAALKELRDLIEK